MRSTHIVPASEQDGHVYHMQAERVLRGNIGRSFDVWQENSSGRATFAWDSGRSYLLFLYEKENRGWVLDGCGDSGPLEKQRSALQEIDALQKRHGGMIQVAIGGDWIVGGPMRGAEVSAQGTQGTFSVATNDKGIAEIHVPAGQYSVTVPNQQIQAFDLTYDLPGKVLIQNGGCAQIQFVQSQVSKKPL